MMKFILKKKFHFNSISVWRGIRIGGGGGWWMSIHSKRNQMLRVAAQTDF